MQGNKDFRRVKLIILYAGRYPGGMAMSRRLHLYAKGLIENKFDVVIAVLSSFEKANPICSRLTYDSVPYHYILNRSRVKSPLLRRMIGLFDGFLMSMHLLSAARSHEIVWSIGFGWFDNLLILAVSRILKKRVVIEINEKPYSMIGNRSDFEVLLILKRWLFTQCVFKRFDGFVVISEALEKLIGKYRRSNSRVLRMPILVDPSKYARLNVDNDPFILHAGTLNERKDGIIGVFQAVAKASQKTMVPFKFILTNKTSLRSTLKKIDTIVREHGLIDRIVFYSHLDESDVNRFLSTANLAIINKPLNEQNRYNFSTKLGEYWAAGVPVITTSVGEVAKFLTHRVNSLVIEANDIEAMSESIVELLENKEFSRQIGDAGTVSANEYFNYSSNTKKLADFLQSL